MARRVDGAGLGGVLDLHVLIEAEPEVDRTDGREDEDRGDDRKFHPCATLPAAQKTSESTSDEASRCTHWTILGDVEPIGLVPKELQSTDRLEFPVKFNVSPISWVQVVPLVEPPA